MNTSARAVHKLHKLQGSASDNNFILFCAALQFCGGLSETNLNEFKVGGDSMRGWIFFCFFLFPEDKS